VSIFFRMACVETRPWVEPPRVSPGIQCAPCVSTRDPCVEEYVSETRTGCTTTYREVGPSVRPCGPPAYTTRSSAPVVVERIGDAYSTQAYPVEPIVYRQTPVPDYVYQSAPHPEAPVPQLTSVADPEWVVMDTNPRVVRPQDSHDPSFLTRSTVRHDVLDRLGGVKTADGRYVIGEAGGSDGIVRLADGSIKYADGTLQHGSPSALKYAEGRASPAVLGLQGSIVMLSDGSTLHADGTIEYPDGTIRKPANLTYSAGAEYTEQAWAKGQATTGTIGHLTQQVAELKTHIEQSGNATLKEQLRVMEEERRSFERELQVLKESNLGGSSPQVAEKEDALRRLQEEFLAEVRENAEARGVLRALQEERGREAETRKVLISEAVMRREQELVREKERALADVRQRLGQEKDALLAQERAQAERLAQTELTAERVKLQAELQQLQDYAEAERKRADEEHQQACVERERAILAEEQLATLQLASPEKKKKKKKSKKGRKGKKKAKTVAKTTAVRVGVISNRTLTTTRTTNVVRKNRVVSKKPARR